MSRNVMRITTGHLRLAATEAGVTTAPDFQCQVTSAAINAISNTETVPATFCEGESTAPAATGWEMAVSWLQDWDVADPNSLSRFAFEHDAEAMWFSLALKETGDPIATGQLYLTAGSFGGTAGAPLTCDATWPLLGKPDITPAFTMALQEQQESLAV